MQENTAKKGEVRTFFEKPFEHFWASTSLFCHFGGTFFSVGKFFKNFFDFFSKNYCKMEILMVL